MVLDEFSLFRHQSACARRPQLSACSVHRHRLIGKGVVKPTPLRLFVKRHLRFVPEIRLHRPSCSRTPSVSLLLRMQELAFALDSYLNAGNEMRKMDDAEPNVILDWPNLTVLWRTSALLPRRLPREVAACGLRCSRPGWINRFSPRRRAWLLSLGKDVARCFVRS